MSPSMLVTDGADSGVGILEWFPKYMRKLSATIERRPKEKSLLQTEKKSQTTTADAAIIFLDENLISGPSRPTQKCRKSIICR